MADEILTVDDLLIEACDEDAEIEEGYFSESLKFILDRDIDEDINNSMNSIFDGNGLSLDQTVIDLVDRLEAEVNEADDELPKQFIVPDVCDSDFDETRINSKLYDWVDEDTPDQFDNFFDTENGEYNPGYDSIFGDN